MEFSISYLTQKYKQFANIGIHKTRVSYKADVFILKSEIGPMNIQKPYIQWGLPPCTIARFGKGALRDIKYSPDGSRLAAATYIGIWIYNVHTCAEIAFLTGHTEPVYSLTFFHSRQCWRR